MNLAGSLTTRRVDMRREARRRGVGRSIQRTGVWSPSGMVGIVLVAVMIGFALLGPLLIPADPAQQDLRTRLAPPFWVTGDWSHPLGTDQLGRDLLARLAAGARVSLGIAVAVTLIAGTLGVALGTVAGTRGALVDRAIGFAVDVQLAIPVVVLAVAVAALFQQGIGTVVVILAGSGWVTYQRVVRLQLRALRSAAFIEAATSLGASRWRIALRHMLPNAVGPVIVLATQQIAAVMLFEAALTYLGVGVPIETITWGGMVSEGREAMFSAWWVATFPGIAIALAVLGFNLFGDALRAMLDPTHRDTEFL
jgi:peptide/nickel transport system permease protein